MEPDATNPGPNKPPLKDPSLKSLKLREIPLTTQFAKEQLDEYLTQQIHDKTYDGTNDRHLPPNELDALALNEIAVSRGQGYFFFLPSRNSWNHQTFEPKSRGPQPDGLGSSVPSLVFMRYTWTQSAQTRFLQSTHRSRYVACDFQINPPPAQTPVYCIQVASGPRHPLYNTLHNSYILFRTNPLYFGSVREIAALLGRPKRALKGPDPLQRLRQAPELWNQEVQDVRLMQYMHTDLESLYNTIASKCHPSNATSSMTTGELWDLLPRPSHPEVGLALGRGSMHVRSRLGGRLNRSTRVVPVVDNITS